MKPKPSSTDEIAGWDARREYLSLLLQLIEEMYNFKLERNIEGYRIAFKQCYILSKFFIQKHIDGLPDKDKDIFDLREIEILISKIRPENTDSEKHENDKIFMRIFSLIEEKEEKLYEFLSREKMLMPTYEKQDLNKAVWDM